MVEHELARKDKDLKVVMAGAQHHETLLTQYPSRVANCLNVLKMLGMQDRIGIVEEDEEVANEDIDEGSDDDASSSSSSGELDFPPSNALGLGSPLNPALDSAP
ncbi:uncharacterized protein A4U43_C04F23900 [Asparagus officinalis]|uniref:Uncharacterized protein n=1 Tax=Asparagus officinalis TaxID=4686 RepID=A0A5P1F7Z0_ASPOF|nr:uncharacterized protein A4U43_C04F23900 [Asparagus officinalis]